MVLSPVCVIAGFLFCGGIDQVEGDELAASGKSSVKT
jgi:hypothetical protein